MRGLTDVHVGSLLDLPFGDEQFDLIFACDVIEHIDDDGKALKELRRVAVDTATLIVTVPAHPWMWSEHDVQLHHVRRYQKKALCAVIENAGWEIREFYSYNALLFPFAALARLVGKVWRRKGHTDLDRTPKVINGVLESLMGIEAKAIRRGIRFPTGVSYGLIASPAKSIP
jgi:SAM-dependent methyltransferase